MEKTAFSAKAAGPARLKFITLMQVIAIILVVATHSLHVYPDGNHGTTTTAYRMFLSMLMPTFIFVSGFLMAYTMILGDRRQSLGRFTWKKVQRLLFPFLTLTLVTFVPRVALSAYADDAVTLSWDSLVGALLWRDRLIIPYLWYLQAVFVLIVMAYALYLAARRLRLGNGAYILVLAVIFLVLYVTGVADTRFFSLDNAWFHGLYFAAGVAYCIYQPWVDAAIRWNRWLTFMCFAAAWLALFFVTDYTPWLVFCSFCGIGMLMTLAHILEARHITIFDHLCGASYIIYLLSWYANVLAQQVMSRFTDFPWWVYSIMSLLAGVYLPFLFFVWLQRNASRPWGSLIARLLGQKV